ncbi:MAG: BON domain-containing protein [Pyrinomonadaceae bacterium]
MNKKLTGLVLGTALSAIAFSACETTTTTNANKVVNAGNGNVATVVNSNANALTANTYTVSSTNSWNANITREEYEKDKANYANRAKETGGTIGQGASDGWIWTKTRAALETTADLRARTINVDVSNDVITLKGTVATAAQKTKAEEVAKGIEGQKGVHVNELQVKPDDSLTNQMVNSNDNMHSNANMKR